MKSQRFNFEPLKRHLDRVLKKVKAQFPVRIWFPNNSCCFAEIQSTNVSDETVKVGIEHYWDVLARSH